MKKNLSVAAMLAALVVPAAADTGRSTPCYGEKEERLAQALRDGIPLLKLQGERALIALWVRERTCATIASQGRVSDPSYARSYFADSRNRAIKLIAERRNVDPLQLQAAIVDVALP